jgi:peptidoglycan/xylan/chitin deacetylase (PgdA/CDA1 family)
MAWKPAARALLHNLGGLSALRWLSRGRLRILMFHEFRECDRPRLDAICEHIVRHFEPLPLSRLIDAIAGRTNLPSNALTVTVDDGYRNYLLHGHPVFRRHNIPITMYVVAGFSDGKLWLWTDRVAFAIEHTRKKTISVELQPGEKQEFDLSSSDAKRMAIARLQEALKLCPNQARVKFVNEVGTLCGVDIPTDPPDFRKPLIWDEIRQLSAEGVAIGCHSYSHPILSRISDQRELESEIRGAKEIIETRLKSAVLHFCYPNGRDIDIGEASISCVRAAGYASAVTGVAGLNPVGANRLQLRRIPVDSWTRLDFAAESLAGLHLNQQQALVLPVSESS